MKQDENIQNMEAWFILLITHLRTLGKIYQKYDLITKFLDD